MAKNATNDRNKPRESLNGALDVLAHPHRRAVLDVLDAEGPATLDELATSIADRDDATSLKHARISLYHRHLPKMVALGVVRTGDRDDVYEFGEVEVEQEILSAVSSRL